MATDTMVMAALSRPFTLGMLYDARRDQLIPGLSLWDDKTVRENTTVSSQHSSAFEITASDTTEQKCSLLNVEASLKVSFLSGLIEVGGSAKYLNDQKKFHNQSRVTLQYKATTNFKQLLVSQLSSNMQQNNAIEKGLATHVVTGIVYGENAFFVFDSEKLDVRHVQDIQGSMEAVIKKIPTFSLEGKVEIKLSEEEKALTEKFSCKFYGDLLLECNPATFEQAVKIYTELPMLLGKSEEIAVPQRVWLMPLKYLVFKSSEKTFFQVPQLMSGISIGLVRKAESALQELKKVEMSCNESLQDKLVKQIPQIHEKISRFQKACNYYTSTLQKALAEQLPSIRAGDQDESALEEIFAERDKSPFCEENLSKWMAHKEREVNVIRSFVDMMEGTNAKVVPNETELDREVLDLRAGNALCFVFTSLGGTDLILEELVHYLDQLKHTANDGRAPTSDQWHFSDEVLTEVRQKAQVFSRLAKALKNVTSIRFLIAAIGNEKHKGASIYHYKDGILITDDFSIPDLPSVQDIKDKRDLIWYACDLTLDEDTANSSLTLSDGNKKATKGTEQQYPDLPQRFDKQPQVLCREGLTGRCYWEVEWSGPYDEWVAVGVAYKGIIRKGDERGSMLGSSDLSWCFAHSAHLNDHTLSAWFDNKKCSSSCPSSGCKRVGLFLDWPAGSLSFYTVSSDALNHIHTFQTGFTRPVYPAFWIGGQSDFAFLCPVD